MPKRAGNKTNRLHGVSTSLVGVPHVFVTVGNVFVLGRSRLLLKRAFRPSGGFAAPTGIAIAFSYVEVKLINSQERLATELSLSRTLRCIGQKLETLDLKAFEIKSRSGTYLVQGIRKGTSSSVDVEFCYTAEDIKRMESEARKNRLRPAHRSNLLNLSQVLRMGGTYVEHVEGRFLKISWQVQSDKIQSITIQYEPHERERKKDEYSASTIDEICVHVYKQRKKLPASFGKHAHGPSDT